MRIFAKQASERAEWEFNVERDSLIDRFAGPYRLGRDIGVRGIWFSADDVERIQIWASEVESKVLLSEAYDARQVEGLIDLRPSALLRRPYGGLRK